MNVNTTGKNDTNSYKLGRGIVTFSPLGTNGLPLAFRDLGNTTEFTLNLASEEVKHYNFQQALKILDRTDTLSKEMTFSLTLDEIDQQNMAMFVSGEVSTYANTAAISGFAKWEMIPAGKVEAIRHYQVKDSSGNRAYNFTATNIALETTDSSPVSLTKDTDYEVNPVTGSIFLLASTKINTAVSAGKGINVTLTATAGAGTVTRVKGLTSLDIVGYLQFEMIDSATEKISVINFPKVKLKADGDASLIGDDWMTLSFTGSAEKNTNMPAGQQIFFVDYPNSQA